MHTSAAEREAMKIERGADDVCLAFLLERHLAERRGEPPAFEGEVVGLIEKGAFVRFGEEGFEGLLPSRRLRGWWTLNELGTALEPRARAGGCASATRSRWRSTASRRRAGGSTCRPPMHTRRC